MIHKINIRGVIIPNDYKWYYNFWGMDSTCPSDVQKVIDNCQPGDTVEVYVNSPGGVIDVGSEIYTLLHQIQDRVTIYVTGEACSAASIISMAAKCIMSPTALMMVHCVSTSADGNHKDMEKTAEILITADNALCTAYMNKSGMTREEVLAMMEAETWLTAEKAKEMGLIDEIMFDEENNKSVLIDGPLFSLPTETQLANAKHMINLDDASGEKTDISSIDITKAKLNLLNLKGVTK